MDEEKLASELVKIAKDLVSYDGGSVMISDLDDWTAYFLDSERDALDSFDKRIYRTVTKHNDTITMGKTIGTPEVSWSVDNKRTYRKLGVGKKFSI